MTLHGDLLQHSEQLATIDPRKPKQVNLRRAVSAAYYAMFHLLTSEASARYAVEPGLAARINRTFNHGEMKKVSLQIVARNFPKALRSPDGRNLISPDSSTEDGVAKVAQAFVSLQQARHEADYDLSRTFSRKEALDFVHEAQVAFEAWERVKNTDEARTYLACLLLWDRWDKDPR